MSPALAGGFFTTRATREAPINDYILQLLGFPGGPVVKDLRWLSGIVIGLPRWLSGKEFQVAPVMSVQET